ncbi:uncharacterized protein LOC121372333 isoform X1 [Gigantopelta aegis]|uniref:uncharacterized protein LOC121372333 isoform X1 n=1 Tax=Gigantopelta aegis TaxID=1735272 RepID=UPI001B88B538|nr:uncharacterized protein LOC121372333 isoform X1 [Gigantopelta aegis]
MSRDFLPSKLLHAQDSIQHRFRDGRTLDSSLRDLLRYPNPEDRLPRMDVMTYGGKHFVVDGNRRLYLLKKLEAAGLVNTVSVNMLPFDFYYFNRKHTTDCEGVSIRIRNDFSMESKIRNIIQQHMQDKSKNEQHGRYSGSSTPGRQERSTMDFGSGSLSLSSRTQPKAATIEDRRFYSLGTVKYRLEQTTTPKVGISELMPEQHETGYSFTCWCLCFSEKPSW